jgi:Skp family chaperone for outer membrane proteins
MSIFRARLLLLAAAGAAALALAAPLMAQTQQVTKVGICDFTKVLTTAYKDTKGYRDFDQARGDFLKEVNARSKEILDLQNQKIDADKAGNKTTSLALEKSISDKQRDLDTYRKVKGAILQQQQDALLGGTVLKEIYDTLKLVAEKGGYSLVLRSDGAYRDAIIYRIPEVDITDDVITALFAKQGKTYNPSGGQ